MKTLSEAMNKLKEDTNTGWNSLILEYVANYGCYADSEMACGITNWVITSLEAEAPDNLIEEIKKITTPYVQVEYTENEALIYEVNGFGKNKILKSKIEI